MPTGCLAIACFSQIQASSWSLFGWASGVGVGVGVDVGDGVVVVHAQQRKAPADWTGEVERDETYGLQCLAALSRRK